MDKLLNILRNERIVGAIGMLLLLVLCLPYIILGEDAYIIIHDNLDGIIANLKLLKDNHALFDPDAILPMMGGIRRSSFGNEWNLTLLPFVFLPCYWANVVNIILVKLTAFVGMFLLLRKYVATDLHPIVSIIISIAFACIPYYATCCGISASGVPLVLYAFLILRDRKRLILSYSLVVYYALYSFLPFSGLFMCVYLFVYGIYLCYKENTIYRHYWSAFALLCGIYLMTNISLLLPFFIDSGYISHRTEFSLCGLITFHDRIYDWWQWVWHSQCHSGIFPVVPIVVFYIISLLFHRTRKMWVMGMIWLSLILIVLAIKCLPNIFPDVRILQEMQFDRFYFLYPCTCMAMLAISAENIVVHFVGYQKIIGTVLACICLVYAAKIVSGDAEIRKNWKCVVLSKSMKEPTYEQFYAENLFNTLSNDLQIGDRKEIKVASLAIYPAIAEYNGFYCIDGYMSDYSLAYKHAFRSIIANELEKDEDIKQYFDIWGNRCYLFSSENQLNFDRNKNDGFTISSLDLNWEALSEMGCKYIFSAVPVLNNQELSCVGIYESTSSYWKLYVYQINTFAQ